MSKLKRNIILFLSGLFIGLGVMLFGAIAFITGLFILGAGAVWAQAHNHLVLYNVFVFTTLISLCVYPFIKDAFKNEGSNA